MPLAGLGPTFCCMSTSRTATGLFVCLVLAAGFVVSTRSEAPGPSPRETLPAPVVDSPAGSPGTQVVLQDAGIDSARLMNALQILAADSMEGRAVGTPGGERARTWLLAEFERLRLGRIGPSFEQPFDAAGQPGVNLIARIEGTERPERHIVLTAHYDHVGIRQGEIHNGADDNASGVSTALEIARVLRSAPPRTSVIIALLDAEEGGLRGARAFVDSPPVPIGSIELNINLDMVARTAGLLWAAGAYHTPELRPTLESLVAGAPLTLRLGHDRPNALEGDDWTQSSDHGPFHAAGIPFVYFGVEDHADYHQPTDDARRVIPAEFLASARTILSAVRALDGALPLSGR